jgi:ATP-binding cassette, subfamily B, bacterial MsbA
MAKALPSDTRPLLTRLWREWVRPHRSTILLVLLCIAIAAAANALYPLLVKGAFDLLDKKDFDTLKWSPLIVILVTSAKGLSMWAQHLLTNRFVTKVEADMQSALYAKLIDSDLSQLAQESPASLTQRFTTDFAFIKEALTRLFTVFLRDVAMLIALVAVLLYIDPWSTLVAAVIAPVVVPPITRIGKKLRRVSTATQEQTGAMAGAISESLSAARIAKTYQLEDHLKDRGRAGFDEIRRLKMKAANVRASMEPVLEIGAGFAIALVIIFVGWRLQNGQTTLGDLAAYSGALIMAAQPVRTLGNLNAIVQEALAALTRYFAIMDRSPTVEDKPGALELRIASGQIDVEGLTFAYHGAAQSAEAATALTDVSFKLPGGTVTALVGRSGSGKSTLLSLVPRLMDPQSGHILIDGQDIRSVSLSSLRRSIAVVSQDVLLFDDTIGRNIAFGRPGASQAEIEQAASDAAAHDFIMAMPDGYETKVGDRGSRLSGGERQRVALARAILRKAPILLLDEATSALDPDSEAAVQMALKRLAVGRTVLVIAHRLSTIRDADQILVMQEGRIVESGKHAHLIKKKGVYASLHDRQFSDI